MVIKCYMKAFVNDDVFALEKELNAFIVKQMVRSSPIQAILVEGRPKFFCYAYYMNEKPLNLPEQVNKNTQTDANPQTASQEKTSEGIGSAGNQKP